MKLKKGTVVSDKMHKTLVVAVVTYKTHPKYKKRYQTSKKYYVHDERGMYKTGDVVQIQPTRPLSKLKRWMVVYPSQA